ncbi:MAG: YbaB/EbfC family nucleoid-associated protein [Verrucomicrobiota bacterium]
MANIAKLMKQAAKMQRQMQEAQAQLADEIVEASSGGGAVKVTASCDGVVKSIKIDPDGVDAEDISMLEDMVLGAVNQALDKARETQSAEMGKLTGGMGGGMGLPGL